MNEDFRFGNQDVIRNLPTTSDVSCDRNRQHSQLNTTTLYTKHSGSMGVAQCCQCHHL